MYMIPNPRCCVFVDKLWFRRVNLGLLIECTHRPVANPTQTEIFLPGIQHFTFSFPRARRGKFCSPPPTLTHHLSALTILNFPVSVHATKRPVTGVFLISASNYPCYLGLALQSLVTFHSIQYRPPWVHHLNLQLGTSVLARTVISHTRVRSSALPC